MTTNVSVPKQNPSLPIQFFIPLLVDQTNSSAFSLELNDIGIPFDVNYEKNLGYNLTSTINSNGTLVLQIPKIGPIIALGDGFSMLNIEGSAFGHDSQINLQYFNGSKWVNMQTGNLFTTSSGTFSYQTVFPEVSSNYLEVNATDGEGNKASAFEVITSPTCSLPASGNWTVSSNCTLSSTITAPQNVIVQSGSVLTIPNGLRLNIDFTHNHLLVKSGGGVLIKSGGAIN